MRFFLIFSIVHLAIALCLQFAFASETTFGLLTVIAASQDQFLVLKANLWIIAAGIAFLLWKDGPTTILQRLPQVLQAVLGSIIHAAAFVIVKTNLPNIAGLWTDQPFFADGFFATLDQNMHFGTDPYVLTHMAFGWVDAYTVDIIYGLIWTTLSLTFLLIVAISDSDQRRIKAFVILFLFSNVGLGHFFALAGMSAGPVFYDRLYDTQRFADLALALQSSGMSESFIGGIQTGLWMSYSSGVIGAGSGISAFPSVHVASAMVVALYFSTRSIWLMPIALAYALAIIVLSVHTGYHYAVDAYASVILIALAWYWLTKRPIPLKD